MELKPQDIVVVLKLLASGFKPWSYSGLGEELSMSASHVFNSILRSQGARLLDGFTPHPAEKARGAFGETNSANLKEFLIYGVKYSFPVTRGGPTRGVPTAEGASPLKERFVESFPLPPVWPYAEGNVRGLEFSPLYRNVPQASLRDPQLYKLLVLVDAIREGRARERELAIDQLTAEIDARI